MHVNNQFKKKRLFTECVESLKATILPNIESKVISEIFKKVFPITEWGKIDWDKIDHKVEVGYNPQSLLEIIPQIIPTYSDSIYIEWSTAGIPIIKTKLENVVKNFDDVTAVSFEKFLFNLDVGLIIEILSSDKITVGTVTSEKITVGRLWYEFFNVFKEKIALFDPEINQSLIKQLKNKFGFERKIVDWNLMQKIEINSYYKIEQTLQECLKDKTISKTVLLIWNSGEPYVIEANFDVVMENLEKIIPLKPKWITDINGNYIIEIVSPENLLIGLRPERNKNIQS